MTSHVGFFPGRKVDDVIGDAAQVGAVGVDRVERGRRRRRLQTSRQERRRLNVVVECQRQRLCESSDLILTVTVPFVSQNLSSHHQSTTSLPDQSCN